MKAVTIMITKPSGKDEAGSGIIWRKIVLTAVIAATLAWLVAGVTTNLGSVAPAQRTILSDKAQSLAKELDAALKIRTAVITSAAYNRTLEKLLASSGLEQFSNCIRGQFTDFLSLEVLNDNGELVAMIGDLLLSQADLAPKDAGENVFRNDPKAFFTGVFRDDIANGCFFLTCRHKNGDGTYWYSRTRFTRRVIEGILSEFQDRATLVSIAGGKNDLEAVYGHPTRAYGNWWSGLKYVEASLESPGWLVKLAPKENGSLFRRASIIIPAMALVLAVIGCFFGNLIRIPARWNNESEQADAGISTARQSSRAVALAKDSADTGDATKTPFQEEIDISGLPKQKELFSVGSETDDCSRREDASTGRDEETHDDYFCPPQLIFHPMADEFAPPTLNLFESAEQKLTAEPPQIEATEYNPDEFAIDSSQVYAEAAVNDISEEISMTGSPGEFFTAEESSIHALEGNFPEELEFFWEEDTSPCTLQIAADNQYQFQAATDEDKLHAEAVPDVLELEWEEPAAAPSTKPKKQGSRESVLLSDFFNC